jgi:GxxExxY protein
MLLQDDDLNSITGRILDAAITVHRHLGPGLLESIYAQCLRIELAASGMRFTVHRGVPIAYKGRPLDTCCRIDLIVEDMVVVEIKAVERLLPVHEAQTLTYLYLTGCRCGLLINFNVPRLMDGVRRLINARIANQR